MEVVNQNCSSSHKFVILLFVSSCYYQLIVAMITALYVYYTRLPLLFVLLSSQWASSHSCESEHVLLPDP